MGVPMMHGMPHQENPAASPPQHHRPPTSNPSYESTTGAPVGAPPVQEAALISFDWATSRCGPRVFDELGCSRSRSSFPLRNARLVRLKQVYSLGIVGCLYHTLTLEFHSTENYQCFRPLSSARWCEQLLVMLFFVALLFSKVGQSTNLVSDCTSRRGG